MTDRGRREIYNYSQRCSPSRGLAPVNRRGVADADRRVKQLDQSAVEGSLLHADDTL